MAAAEKFKAPEASAAVGEAQNTVTQPIQEESDEEEVVYLTFVIKLRLFSRRGIRLVELLITIVVLCIFIYCLRKF